MHFRDENFRNRFERAPLGRSVSPILPHSNINDMPSINLYFDMDYHESRADEAGPAIEHNAKNARPGPFIHGE